MRMRKWEKNFLKIVQFRKLTRISIDYYLRMRQTLYVLGTIFLMDALCKDFIIN